MSNGNGNSPRNGRNTALHAALWDAHPGVPTRSELTFGQHAADLLKAAFSTWHVLLVILGFIVVWTTTNGFGTERWPYFGLDLVVTCLAAVMGFAILIAEKRSAQIASEIAAHTEQNTEMLMTLLRENTDLTKAVNGLTREVHKHILETT